MQELMSARRARPRGCYRAALVVAMASLLAIGCDRRPETAAAAKEHEERSRSQPSPPAERDAEPVELQAGEAVERAIMPGETHEYRLVLEAGDFIEFAVEQRGIDVELSLTDPEDELILVMDLPIADLGSERLLAVADQEGRHAIRVRAWEGEDPAGNYMATLAVRRQAHSVDRLRSLAARLFYRGQMASSKGRFSEAIESYIESRRAWQQASDEYWVAVTLDQEGYARNRLGELAKATSLHESAAGMLIGMNEPHLAAINANHLAQTYLQRGDLDRSIQHLQRALALRRKSNDRRGEGMTLGMLARIYGVRGNVQQALDFYDRALVLLDRKEDRRYRATALHDFGTLYHRLGMHVEAVFKLRAAEQIYAELGEFRRQAYSLGQIGQLVFEAGNSERALRTLTKALQLGRQHGDPVVQVAILRRIGSVLLARGEPDNARARYAEALGLLSERDNPRSEATVLADLGALSLQIGDAERARDHYRRANALFLQVGDPVQHAKGLLGEAAALRELKQLDVALDSAAKALEIAEELRVKPFSEEVRVSYFSTAQPAFDLNISLLMDLHSSAPSGGYAAEALKVNERARARSLLDLLAEAGAEIRSDAAPALLKQEREMQYRLNASLQVMESPDATERQRREAAREVRLAVAHLGEIRGAIRRTSPRYAALTQPRPLTLGQIQRLLDADTTLLEFRLGRNRSHLWLVSRDDLATFELPPRGEIELAARQSHHLMARPRRESEGRLRALLCRLSLQILGPAAGRLNGQRLAIVADGALQYVPFAALPDPDSVAGCAGSEPLVSSHEIVHLPSASALALMRLEANHRIAPAGTIAVVADPVFNHDDPRLEGRLSARLDNPKLDKQPAPTLQGPETSAPSTFRRLPHSRSEAMAILGMVPDSSSYSALGFEASKKTVVSGRLGGYRIVHFATHGDLNAQEPALSRIVLSQVGPRGEALEGSLRAHEIYGLNLPADLVVLSGCRTALGKEIRGEGLVGLARGFMYAGASRVMVSLWEVGDRSTAELMKSFYFSLLREGRTPAAALRAAQVEMRDARPHPFYWAGFVLEGDWR